MAQGNKGFLWSLASMTNRCRLVCVKFHLNRCRFAVADAECSGGSLFLGHSVEINNKPKTDKQILQRQTSCQSQYTQYYQWYEIYTKFTKMTDNVCPITYRRETIDIRSYLQSKLLTIKILESNSKLSRLDLAKCLSELQFNLKNITTNKLLNSKQYYREKI